MLQVLSILFARTWDKGEQKSTLRRQNSSVHALFMGWLMFLVSHLGCAPLPGPNSGRTLNRPVIQANRQWWMSVMVREMNVGLILSIDDLWFIPICSMRWKYVQWIRSTMWVKANWHLHSEIDCQNNDQTRRWLWNYLTTVCGACQPVLGQYPGLPVSLSLLAALFEIWNHSRLRSCSSIELMHGSK